MSKALRVLITGAARGIGMATAQVLAKRGHWVVATDISPLSGLEGIQAHVLDVTSDDSVSSVSGRVSSPLGAAYSASKFALEALTESLHHEVRHFGIRSVLIEPGNIATGTKAIEPHQGPADYAGLWEQCAGANTKTTGPSGPPGPEVVALAIASAIEDPATPLRVPVGQDAEMILGLRRSLDDQAFEDAMRKAIGITW